MSRSLPAWSWIVPVAGLALYGGASLLGMKVELGWSASGIGLMLLVALALVGAVFTSVHHSEAIAHVTGEPYGTLILTAAVTIIELALIVSVMLAGDSSPTLARDTVYAVVMIVCNGLVGACILMGGLRFREQGFEVTSVNIYLAVLIVIATLTLVLPNYVLSTPGPVFSDSQLTFICLAIVALYGVFLYIQTVRHSDYFIPGDGDPQAASELSPWGRIFLINGTLLVLSLTAVVLLAKQSAAVIDQGLAAIGAPAAVAGVLIAFLILLPESMSALQAARRDELQKSLNLALGSSLATIGLTVPAVAAVNIFLQERLVLGLETKETVLLIMTFAASTLTLGTGRTNILFGFVHLVIFATFLFLTFVP